MHKNPVGGKILVNTLLAAHCTTRKSTRSSRAIRAALAIMSATLLFVCGIFGGLSWMPLAGGMLTPLTAHAQEWTITIYADRLSFWGDERNGDFTNLGKVSVSNNGSIVFSDSNNNPIGSTVQVALLTDEIILHLEINVAINEIDLSYPGPITITGKGSLTVNGEFKNNSNLTINNDGGLIINSITASNNGTINNNKALTINNVASFTNNGTMTNNDGGTVTNSGRIKNNEGHNITNNGTMTNNSGGTVENSGRLTNGSDGSFTNEGTMYNSHIGSVTNDGVMTNSGSMRNGPNANFTNNKTMNNTGSGTVTNDGRMTNNGDMTNGSNGTITNEGTMTNGRAGTVTNNGNMNNSNIGTVTNNGNINNSNIGTVTNNGTVNNQDGATLSNSGSFTNNQTIHNAGTLTNNGTFYNNGTINVTGNGKINGSNPPIGGTINYPPQPPAPAPAPASSCASGHASYTWQTVTSADVHNDGEMVFACAGCGHVLYRVPVSAYGPFQKVTAEKIRNAAPGATVEIATSRWYSFHRSVMEALAARPDVTLTISFLDGEYRGNRRIVTIPAGYDTLSLLNGTDYCGFLYLGSKFGLH